MLPRGEWTQGLESLPLLKEEEVPDHLWLPKDYIFTLEPTIATTGESFLPKPVGHVRTKERKGRCLVHSPKGPGKAPSTVTDHLGGWGNILIPVGEQTKGQRIRGLAPLELWLALGGNRNEWGTLPSEKARTEALKEAIKEPGIQNQRTWPEFVLKHFKD